MARPPDPRSPHDKSLHVQPRYRLPAGAREIILVRHGSTIRADERLDYGKLVLTNPPLSPIGHQQAEMVCDRLLNEPIKKIFVTIFQRTHQTIAPLVAKIGLTPIVVPELREIYMGDYEHEVHVRIAAGDPLYRQMYIDETFDVIPNAERTEEFAARVRVGIEKIVEQVEPDSVTVSVSHAATIAMICRLATGSRPFAFLAPENTSVSRLVVHRDGHWSLRCFNDVSHLPRADVEH